MKHLKNTLCSSLIVGLAASFATVEAQGPAQQQQQPQFRSDRASSGSPQSGGQPAAQRQTQPSSSPYVDRSSHGTIRHADSPYDRPARPSQPKSSPQVSQPQQPQPGQQSKPQQQPTPRRDDDAHAFPQQPKSPKPQPPSRHDDYDHAFPQQPKPSPQPSPRRDDDRYRDHGRDYDAPQRHYAGPRDIDVNIRRDYHWRGFVYGERCPRMRPSCVQIFIGSLSYFYDDGIYYQPVGQVYQVVYPPVGAIVPALPAGYYQLIYGNYVYYYAGGAFYVQQGNCFVVVNPPIGIAVPELPPGSTQVLMNGYVVYQFNTVYYRPVFINGVAQYVTFVQ